MDISIIVNIGIQSAAIIEFLKQALLKSLQTRFALSDDTYRILITVLVALVGTLLAYAQNVTFTGWNPVASAIATGIAATLPSSALHALYDGFKGILENWAAPTTSAPAPEPPAVG